MSGQASGRLFAIVREAECSALKGLSPNACKLWIAIRYGRKENEPFACGCRDFEGWGLGRTAVALALKELVAAGLLKIVAHGSFGKRGRRTEFKIIHTKAFEREQSALADNKLEKSPSSRTTNWKRVRPCGQQTAKESALADTPKDTSSTSSRKSKEEEVSVAATSEAKRHAGVEANKARMLRIEQAARAVAMSDQAFIKAGGGPSAADFLALRFESGKLTELQLRARLAESQAGSASKAVERAVGAAGERELHRKARVG